LSVARDHILILEDDATLLNALSEAFKREGFVTHLASSPDQARHLLQTQPIGVLFIDCLLPSQSGVEFVQDIRSAYPPNVLEVVFMSGIFMDPLFMKEALRSAKAKHFLRKPFELTEALALVDKPVTAKVVTSSQVPPRKALYELFSKGKLTTREKRKAIEALDEIHGFDLPFIYSLLVESRVSGGLNIATDTGAVFGISFSHGSIIRVDIPDQETYVGKLLIEGGHIHPEDLEKAFQDKSNKRIGEKLISNFFISPHTLDRVLSQQMNIRISKTIVDQNLKINFIEHESELIYPNISPEQFRSFLHDWIASKINLSWLKAHFTQWGNSPIMKTPLHNSDSTALQAPLVQALSGVVDFITSGQTFGQIIDSQKYEEEPLLKAIHFLLTRGVIVFSSPLNNVTAVDHLKYLKKLHTQFAGQNKIEIYDLLVKMTGVNESDPDAVLKEFNKLLGPTPAATEKEQSSLYSQIQIISQQAYQIAKSGNRTKLKDKFEKDELEIKMKAAHNYEEAKNLLQKGQFKPALDLFKKIQNIDPDLMKMRIYFNWARLGLIDQDPQRAQTLKQIELDLLQVPPEEKFDAIYSYVMGLVAKAKSDFVSARRFFDKAIALDSNMIVARREIASLQGAIEKNKDIFNRDLKDVVGSFFKKR